MGDTVVTTLDADLQEAAYQALGEKKGAVVVMEPKTGRSLPSLFPLTTLRVYGLLKVSSLKNTLLTP